MKGFFLSLISGVLMLALMSCSGPQIEVKNDTPMAAAKTFVKAMIKGDKEALSKVVDPQTSIPVDAVLAIADHRNLDEMKISQFHFKKDKDSSVQILITFKDPSGNEDHWMFNFHEENKQTGYTYFGERSGALVYNETPVSVGKVYTRAILEPNKNLLNEVTKATCGNRCPKVRFSKQGAKVKDMDQLQFKWVAEGSPFPTVRVRLNKTNGKVIDWYLALKHFDDGYYFRGIVTG